ncbi:hypothetical protein [Niveibacterium terrae]|uniref:hypothetical protein n=1 Tax=Niveibacterium terrae TaxID=3373598 RepID=UPI003A9003D2
MTFSPSRLAPFAVVLSLLACGQDSGPPMPTGLTVIPGDGSATLSWDENTAYNYTIFSAQATEITRSNYESFPNAKVTWPVTSPYVLTGLTNEKPYAFLINARDGSGPAGDSTASVTTTPHMRGSNWANGVTINAASDFRGITYGQGRYVAVGSNGALYSCTYNGLATASSTGCPNGAAWTAETLPTATSSSPASTNDLNSVAYNSYTGQFVAVGAAGTILRGIYSSTTKTITWTSAYYSSSSSTLPTLYSVAAVGTGFVAVGASGTVITGATTSSSSTYDTLSWTVQTSPTTKDLYSVAYLNSTYIVLGAGGTLLTAGSIGSWSTQTTGVTTDLYGIAYGTTGTAATATYLVVGSSGTLLRSTGLTSWTPVTGLKTGSADLRSIAFGSQFVIAGAGQNIMSCDAANSTNGTANCDPSAGANWTLAYSGGTATLNKVLYGGGTYVAVGSTGSNMIAIDK